MQEKVGKNSRFLLLLGVSEQTLQMAFPRNYSNLQRRGKGGLLLKEVECPRVYSRLVLERQRFRLGERSEA